MVHLTDIQNGPVVPETRLCEVAQACRGAHVAPEWPGAVALFSHGLRLPRIGWVAAGAVLCAAALVACGGGSDGASEMGASFVDTEAEPGTQTASPPTGVSSDIGLPLTTGFSAASATVRVQSTSEVAQRAGDGVGAFRTVCGPTHMSYDDPIVFPGQPGKSHLHTFFGNAGVNGNSTDSSIRNSGNSSCRGGTLNRSGYWVPSMVDTRTNMAVMPRTANFYYKTGYRGVRPADVRPFPAGLRMIAGDAKNTRAGGGAWRYHCHSGSGFGSSIPNCGVGDEMVQEIFFPQCWDGVNLDSPDHKSHMAYADPARPGCPASHPVPLPEITYNIHYRIGSANQATYWRLSSDAYTGPAGYSAHGDWWNGWDQAAMETFVRTCNNQALDCKSHLLGDGRAIY